MINGVTSYLEDLERHDDAFRADRLGLVSELKQSYGGFLVAIWTLFRGISGSDWSKFAAPLMQASWIYGGMWVPYIGFVVFGLLNIVTGIFVDSTLKTAEADHTVAVIEQMRKEEGMRELLSTILGAVDADGTGRLTEDEWGELVGNPEVLAFLASVGIDRKSAHRLFKMLDPDGTGIVSLESVVNGCFHIRGGASAIDMLQVLQHLKMLERTVNALQNPRSPRQMLPRHNFTSSMSNF